MACNPVFPSLNPSPLECGIPLYKPYRYVPPQSDMVFEGTKGAYERIYCFNFK